LLPADEGAWSLEGMAHATTLITHFALEGKIRRRAPYSDKFRLLIGPPRNGSWVADFFIQLAGSEVWAGAAAGAAVSSVPGLFKLIRRISKRATGQEDQDDGASVLEKGKPGTFDALVEAVEPSLLRAHRVIHNERTHIEIRAGGVSIEFDRSTRRYLEMTEIDDAPRIIMENVASYNVNNRTGRVFINQLGRTVPFQLIKEIDKNSEISIAQSLQNYTVNRLANSDLEIRALAKRAYDDRIKSVVIVSARFVFGIERGV